MTFTGVEKVLAVVDKAETVTGAWAVFVAADRSGTNPSANLGVTAIVQPTGSSMTLFDSNQTVTPAPNSFTCAANVSGVSGAILCILPASGSVISRDSTSSLAYGSTHSWTHTSAGNASTLIVAVRDDGANVTEVTYGSAGMSLLGSVTAGGGTYYMYILFGPTAGSNTITVSSSTSNISGAAVSYIGAESSVPDSVAINTTTAGASVNQVSITFRAGSGQEIVLSQITFDEMHITPIRLQPARHFAITNMHANSVDIYVDVIPSSPFKLYADGITTVLTLAGNQTPDLPESFHDILVWGAMADEYQKMEKPQLKQSAEQDYETRLSDLRMFIAKSSYLDIHQGRYTGKTFRWTRDAQILWDS